MKEVKEMVVDTCVNVITKLAAEQSLVKERLVVRIDMETIKAKPVFGLFNLSDFLCRKTLKEIIKAGGGQGFGLILGTYIKQIIRDIFRQTMTEMKIKDSKELFVLLYLEKEHDTLVPMISVYHKGEFIWSMLIGEAVDAAPKL